MLVCSEEIQEEAEESEWIGYNTMIRFKEASEAQAAKGIEESPTGPEVRQLPHRVGQVGAQQVRGIQTRRRNWQLQMVAGDQWLILE